MNIPFTTQQFLEVFGAYNTAIWPLQFGLLAVAVAALQISAASSQRAEMVPPLLLSVLWAWSGGLYHLVFFRRINPAAAVFGAVFLLQALLIVVAAARGRLTFRFRRSGAGWMGMVFIVYALVVYPAVGLLAGQRYPNLPTFGAPCPVTIFTLGLLLWNTRRTPVYVIAIPLIWSAVGTSAALSLGIVEDIGLAIAAILALATVVRARSVGQVTSR